MATLMLACLLGQGASAQSNQVRIQDFDWKVASTEHFDIHYYEDGEALVPFAARILERSYTRISKDLDAGWPEKERRPFFLYANLNDMQQSTIVAVGDGTGGVTEAFKNRFIVFNDGSKAWLDTVTTHELAHVFQFRILVDGFWKSARVLKTIVYPLWMMEGMAEYFSWGLDDTAGEIVVRDAATSGGLIPLWKLEQFSHLKPHQVRLAYESGEKVLRFLEAEYGSSMVRRMIKLFESRFETSAVISELTGLDVFQFDKKWREYAKEKWARVVKRERLAEPEAYGVPMTTPGGDEIPQFNTAPTYTPDGTKLIYLTTRFAFPPVIMVREVDTGRERKLVRFNTKIETLHLGNFTNISRVMSVSPDGSDLIFAGTKNKRDAFFIKQINGGGLRKIEVEGFDKISQPSYAPDGKSVVFSGMKGSYTDIYAMDLKTHEVRRLTQDPQDDQTPNVSPDGRYVVYSSEIEVPGSDMLYQRRLYRVPIGGGAPERLTDLPGAARDPVHSPDGSRVLFSLEKGGFYDLYELNLESRQVRRRTRSIGAAYTPVYAPGGRIAFAGYRRGSVHIYAGDRRRFLDEIVNKDVQRFEEPVKQVAVSTSAPRMSMPMGARSPFSTDLFLPAFFYSSNGGLFWSSYWQGSDLLGRHQGLALISYASGSGFLDYQTAYGYNRWRPTLQLGFFGRLRRDTFDDSTGFTQNESFHGQFVGASYPLDRFSRLELSLSAASGHLFFQNTDERVRREARTGTASFVHDTVRGRYLVATSGRRLRLSYSGSPRVLGGNFTTQSVLAEGVQYFPTDPMGGFVFRALGFRQWGADAIQFILGGIGGVRGFGRSTNRDLGRNGGLGTLEWRFPVLRNLDYYMWYIFPDFYFKAISLAVFSDLGTVWDSRDDFGRLQFRDIRHSYGIGLRLHTFILQLVPLVLHFDYARRTNSPGGVFYVYLGPLF